MGASSWLYYTPYQENIEQAFHDLRQHVFETGDYSHWWRLHDYGENYGLVDISGEEIFPVPSPPQTIEEVIARSRPEGTHSILDIGRVITDSRYYGDVLAEEVIQQFFAEEQPSRLVVKAIIFNDKFWSRLKGDVAIQRKYGSGIPRFSGEVLDFFAAEWSREKFVAALLAHEDIWIGIRRALCLYIEQFAIMTRYGTAMPLSPEDLIKYFGSEKPTKAVAEACFARRDIWSMMHSGVGYYGIIYENGLPHEIFFAGFSGD